MFVHRSLALVLLVALVVASGCGGASSPPPERLVAPPAAGAIVYSVEVDPILLAYEQGMLVDGSGTVNLTETDHRVVRAVAGDGRLMVLEDYHDHGGGLYLRWQARSGRVHTVRLTVEPNEPVAVCGSDSAVYVDGAHLMRWDAGTSTPHRLATPLVPQRLSCSPTGRIAALTRTGALLLGDSSGGLSAMADGRYADAVWSSTDRLAACTEPVDDQPGRLMLIDESGAERRSLTQIGGGCALGWAPDGRHIAATSDTGRMIVACACTEEPHTVLAADAVGQPSWSPDGTAIAYTGFLDLRAVTYPTGHSVLIADDPSSIIAWLDPPASRRALRLADPYPCCGP